VKKRSGKPTFSISVDCETQRILEQEAPCSHGGNVGALVAALAKEAKQQAALDWLLRGTSVTDRQRALFLDEVDGKNKPRKPRRTA